MDVAPKSVQKKSPVVGLTTTGQIPGDDLLSQDLSSHYHRRCVVSLPGSEWDRVVPTRSGHQRAILFDQDWDSGELSYFSLLVGSVQISGEEASRWACSY